MTDASLEPLFIVGTSRAGTTLVSRSLSFHAELAIAPETHYFDDLRQKLEDPTAPLDDGPARKRVEDYFLALGHRPYGYGGDPEQSSRFDRAELRTRAAARGTSADAHFEAFCDIVLDRRGGSRWGEKTPRHVFRLPAILAAYPRARALVLVRDPRAVVASYRDWRRESDSDDAEIAKEFERQRASYHPVLQSLLWRSTLRAGLGARARFGAERVRVERYERIVAAPEATLRELCDWMELEFDAAMLDVPVLNSTYVEGKVEGEGFSQEAADRWRKKMDSAEVRIVQSACAREMQEAGYDVLAVSGGRLRFLGAWLGLPFALLRATLANRSRIGNLPQYLWSRLRLALGR